MKIVHATFHPNVVLRRYVSYLQCGCGVFFLFFFILALGLLRTTDYPAESLTQTDRRIERACTVERVVIKATRIGRLQLWGRRVAANMPMCRQSFVKRVRAPNFNLVPRMSRRRRPHRTSFSRGHDDEWTHAVLLLHLVCHHLRSKWDK